MPCCIGQNSIIIGSIKDPSGRKVVITQAFAFMTIFLHPGGQRPASIHECGQMPLANCLWQMPLANAVQNTSAMANSPPAPDPNSNIPAVLQGPNCRCISFAVLANLPKRAHPTTAPELTRMVSLGNTGVVLSSSPLISGRLIMPRQRSSPNPNLAQKYFTGPET